MKPEELEKKIENAYRKLKHVIYYDSTYSFNRSLIALFEKNNPMFGKDPLDNPIIPEVFGNLAKEIAKGDIESDYFQELFQEISCWILPKKVKNDTIGFDDDNILTNTPIDCNQITVTKDFKLINAPIQLHLISILWIMEGGYLLEKSMEVEPYGNKLELSADSDGIVDGLRLFKPYHKRYKKWRNQAFEKALRIIKEDKENALIISLDVKEFYPSVILDFGEITSAVTKALNDKNSIPSKTFIFLSKIIQAIHEKYLEKITSYPKDELEIIQTIHEKYLEEITSYPTGELEKNEKISTDTPSDEYSFEDNSLKQNGEKKKEAKKSSWERIVKGLPIGFPSSAVIANWYLGKFDEKVKNTINPVYYARYVDDIMMVIANPNIKGYEKDIKSRVFKWYFERNDILRNKNVALEKISMPVENINNCTTQEKKKDNEKCCKKNKENHYYRLLLYDACEKLTDKNKHKICLEIQESKSKFYYFDKDQPTALLDKIKRELAIESSEFKYLPEEKKLFQDFYTEAHFLSFDGSVNKLRNVSGFGVNLFGASRFLAKKIFSALQSERKTDREAEKQLNIFFKNGRAIDTSKLWEKAATYFVVTKDIKGLVRFIKNVKEAIKKIKFVRECDKKQKYLENKEYSKEIQDNLHLLLVGSVSMALSLDLTWLNNIEDNDILEDDIDNSSTQKEVNKIIGMLYLDNLNKSIIYRGSNEKNYLKTHVLQIRKALMVRHNYVCSPLINFTNVGINGKTNEIKDNNKSKKITKHQSYLDPDIFPEIGVNRDFDIEDCICPRFVHLHEIVLALYRKELDRASNIIFEKGLPKSTQEVDLFLKKNNKSEKPDTENNEPKEKNKEKISEQEHAEKGLSAQALLKKAFSLFEKLNKISGVTQKKLKIEATESFWITEKRKIEKKEKTKQELEENVESAIIVEKPVVVVEKIKFKSTPKSKELCIGLVNMNLNDEFNKQSYLQNPIFNKERKEEFNYLLNLIHTTQNQIGRKIDVLILPEVSVPFKALDWLCDYAQRHQIMMIFGVEHWVRNNVAFNLLATLIPFPIKGFEDSKDNFGGLLPLFRIKNHYAHEEDTELKSYRYNIPKPDPNRYYHITWKGIQFAVFNCFELADIRHRALFRSEVDVLFACEYNSDIPYYSNIVESIVRDIHCYFVQSNNAKQGDSRITKPSKSVEMNQTQIKGGKNVAIIVDTINIQELRDFQIQDYISSYENRSFKPLPPGFDVEKAMKRRGKSLNNKSK